MGRQYIRFDEIEDVLVSIELLELVGPLLHRQPSYWKWAIVSAQSALQTAMVCVLGGTSGVGVLDEKSARKVLRWHESKIGPYPEGRLADFNELLDRCCKNGLDLTPKQEQDVRRLHTEFRNNFAHFSPMSWSIEKAGLPRIIGTTIDCVEELMSSDEVRHKVSGNRKRRLEQSIGNIRTVFKSPNP